MNKEQFWQLINHSLPANTQAEQLETIRRSLALISLTDLEHFQEHLTDLLICSHRYDLWAVAALLNNGCTEEEFIGFQIGLIGSGQVLFDQAINDPDSLASSASSLRYLGFIQLLHLAPFIYYARCGKTLVGFDGKQLSLLGEPIDVQDIQSLKTLFPALFQSISNRKSIA